MSEVDEGGVEGAFHVVNDSLVDVALDRSAFRGFDVQVDQLAILNHCDPQLVGYGRVDEHSGGHEDWSFRMGCRGIAPRGSRADLRRQKPASFTHHKLIFRRSPTRIALT